MFLEFYTPKHHFCKNFFLKPILIWSWKKEFCNGYCRVSDNQWWKGRKSYHCVEMIKWLCGNFRRAKGFYYWLNKCQKKCKIYERHALFNCVVYNYSKKEIATEPLDHFHIMIGSPHSHWIIYTQWLDHHTTLGSFPHNDWITTQPSYHFHTISLDT